MVLTRRSVAARLFLGVSAAMLAALACAACSSAGSPSTTEPNPTAVVMPVEARPWPSQRRRWRCSCRPTSGHPAPTLGVRRFPKPLRAHQVVGFLPYWEVGGFTPDFADLTTLAYWSVTLASGGSIDRSGQGYSTLSSADAGLDISGPTRRVSGCCSACSRKATRSSARSRPIPRQPAVCSPTRSSALLSRGDFDGVDLDIEGDSTPDRGGFVQFVASFSKSLEVDEPPLVDHARHLPELGFRPTGLLRHKGAHADMSTSSSSWPTTCRTRGSLRQPRRLRTPPWTTP